MYSYLQVPTVGYGVAWPLSGLPTPRACVPAYDCIATCTQINGGSRGGARERAHPRLRKFFNVQTIFKHVSMCVRNLLGACIDASAAVQRLCPYLCHVHV